MRYSTSTIGVFPWSSPPLRSKRDDWFISVQIQIVTFYWKWFDWDIVSFYLEKIMRYCNLMTLYKRSTMGCLSTNYGFKKKKNKKNLSIVWELEVKIALQSHFQENIPQKPKIWVDRRLFSLQLVTSFKLWDFLHQKKHLRWEWDLHQSKCTKPKWLIAFAIEVCMQMKMWQSF